MTMTGVLMACAQCNKLFKPQKYQRQRGYGFCGLSCATRKQALERWRNPEHRARVSEALRERWQKPEYRARWIKARRNRGQERRTTMAQDPLRELLCDTELREKLIDCAFELALEFRNPHEKLGETSAWAVVFVLSSWRHVMCRAVTMRLKEHLAATQPKAPIDKLDPFYNVQVEYHAHNRRDNPPVAKRPHER
jgi:hypothetical protein